MSVIQCPQTCRQLALEHVPAADMAASFHTVWSTFRKGRSKSCDMNPHAMDSSIIDRQMNMDYSICNALKYFTAGLIAALIIYDIACQWWINFLRRVESSRHLAVPPGMKLLTAVGSFHLSSHVPQCFALYSLHFMHGAGQIDGEILETLWKEFNKVSPSTKPMSAAHRREVCDDFMRDSNWKKLVGICAYFLLVSWTHQLIV